MDKLKRVLSGNDSPDEESGIMSQVTFLNLFTRILINKIILVR